jgi:hypothetical protein
MKLRSLTVVMKVRLRSMKNFHETFPFQTFMLGMVSCGKGRQQLLSLVSQLRIFRLA